MSDFTVASLGARRQVPVAVNEPIRSYAPGTPERASLKARLASMAGEHVDIPVIVNGKEYRTGDTAPVVMPHDHAHVLGTWHKATPELVQEAIAATAAAREDWSRWAWEDRAAVFLRAAELLSTTWRDTINAATMLGQSKTAFQSEIDAACELIDFFRFNCAYVEDLYGEQPISEKGVWNQTDYRPLEGFVYAVSPFNFTAIGGNLSGAPALVGNTVIWKPAQTAMLSGYYVMKLLEAAGLPPGVINFVPGDPVPISDALLSHADLGGVHFTGSTTVFNSMWKTIGSRMGAYRSYPRIVGETGGKDFIMAHASADVDALAVAIVRGAFEYQGQKCSACSRVYIPQSLWAGVRDRMVAMMADIKMGDVRDFRNFMGAVIDEKSFTKIGGYLDEAREDRDDHQRRHCQQGRRLLRRADAGAGRGSRRASALRGDLRPVRHRVRVPRRPVRGDDEDRGPHVAVRADGRHLRRRPSRRSPRPHPPAQRRRQLLHQRQVHRRRGGPAALRRCARLGHQRQGRQQAQSPALGERTLDQGDVLAAEGLPVPVHGGRVTPDA